ncbi:unnamed protein product [Cuscuta europaea]|uniref:DUF1421 domain-containing protein n=1 Tax=Cuscuta europaea TaxID=41803 RepID=A0A9P1DZ26_CUSEU|nr:unnamed protein product [Cuscuta europaea]
MDLSTSPSAGNSKADLIDFVNTEQDLTATVPKKEEIVPSYEFHPIRPVVSSQQSLPNANSSNESVPKAWNSADSKTSTASIIKYGPHEPMESVKVIVEKNENRFDSTLISEIDHILKKYTDNLLHALEGASAQISQLETRSRRIESSMDDLKLAVGDYFGSTDGKLRHLENLVREVHTEVKAIRDKQDIVEAKMQIAKLEVEQQVVEDHGTHPSDSLQAASAPQHSHHQQPAFPSALAHLPSQSFPPPHHHPQQNLPSQAQIPNQQYQLNQISSVPPRESYTPAPGLTPEIPSQIYQMPLSQQIQPSPPPPPPQYQSTPQLQYSQPPQSNSAFPSANPSQSPQLKPQPSLGHHTEEASFIPPHQGYPPNIHKTPSMPSGGALSQQFYGAPPNNIYEIPSIRPGPGFSGGYGPSSVPGEPYLHSSSFSQYGSGSPSKSQLPMTMNHQSGGSGYTQLPTAKILPQAPPTASPIVASAGSTGSGNRVPVDDVVDKVTLMGFPRDQVRETVRKLTDNGQAVDLNVVLDKLMNDGDVQPPRGWFGR